MKKYRKHKFKCGMYPKTAPMTDDEEIVRQLNSNAGAQDIDLLIDTGRNLYISDPDKSKFHLDEAVSLAQKLKYKSGLASAFRVLGNVFWVKGDYEAAMERYHRAKNIFVRLDDKENLILVYKAIGRTYSNLDDLGNSLRYLHLALDVAEEIDNQASIATCCNGLGFAYYHNCDYDMALTYFQKGLVINETLGNKFGSAMSYNNIADICRKFKKLDQALDFALKALDLLEQIGRHNEGFACEFNLTIADIYLEQNKNEHALKRYNKAHAISVNIDYKEGIILSSAKLGKYYIKINKFDQAAEILKSAVALAAETGNSKEESHCRRLLKMLENVKAATLSI